MITKTKTKRHCPICGKVFYSKRHTYCSSKCYENSLPLRFQQGRPPKYCDKKENVKKTEPTFTELWRRYESILEKYFPNKPSFCIWCGQHGFKPDSKLIDIIIVRERQRSKQYDNKL